MSMPTKDEFFFEIGEAEEDLKIDLYKRLEQIEEAFVESKIAASKSNTSYGSPSIGVFLEGIDLNAPNQTILNDIGELIGEVSLPNNLKDFFQIFCSGSTHTAYHLLKIAKRTSRHSRNKEIRSLIADLQPKTYFIDIVDRLYKFYIGNNPKYARNGPIKASKEQLAASTIYTHKIPMNKETVIYSFLESFQVIFNDEPRALGVRSLHPVLNGYCQVCHRPNTSNKKYCNAHVYDPISRNSPAKTPLRWAEKSFRNLGLYLHNEAGLAVTSPESYIKEAKEKRKALVKDKERQKALESEILSEYCVKLEGWAKHHPLYLNFYKSIASLLIKYKDNLNCTQWKSQECIDEINEIISLCKKTHFITDKIFPSELKNIPVENIKPLLLGPDCLDVDPKLHSSITIDDWATMLCRHFQLELAFICRKNKMASLLNYFDP